MTANHELYERTVHKISPMWAYCASSVLLLLVAAALPASAGASWSLLWVGLELARMTSAFAWARQQIERGWLIRIRRTFRIVQHGSRVQVCVDGRCWYREQVRGVGLEARATEGDPYFRVHLLMGDCLILVHEGLPLPAAAQECLCLARLLNLHEAPYPVGLPARFAAAALFGSFRLPLVPAIAFQTPGTGWLLWSAGLLLDLGCVWIARARRHGARAEARQLGLLPEAIAESPMNGPMERAQP